MQAGYTEASSLKPACSIRRAFTLHSKGAAFTLPAEVRIVCFLKKQNKINPQNTFAPLLPEQGFRCALFRHLHLNVFIALALSSCCSSFFVLLENSRHHKHVGCKSKQISIYSFASLIGMLSVLEL